MAYWLMKSEPDVFSIDDLARENVAGWDGVRNYQARKNLRAMKKGDLALFYHSSIQPPVVAGLMEIAREAYPDKTADEPGWEQVDVKFVKRFSKPLSLDEVKKIPALKDMVLLHNSRLSVQPVSRQEWEVLSKILSAILIAVALWTPSHAECTYFRTTMKLVSCASVAANELTPDDTSQAPSDLPGLDNSQNRPIVKAKCDCDYSLKGSDPTCDTDQSIERTSIVDVDEVSAACRRGNSLCRDVCPDSLP